MSTTITIAGTDRTDKFDSFSFRIVRNKRTYNSLRATLYSEDFTLEEGTEVITAIDSNTEFGGLLQTVRNNPTTVQNKYNVYATSYEQICDRRTISASYTDTDCDTIVTALVNDFLSDEGITIGNIDTGANVTYQKNAVSIKDMLDDLAVTSGYVWFINDAKELYFQDDYNYTSGTFPTDYEVVEVGRSLTGYANKIFVVGGGGVIASAEDTAEITKMGLRFGSGVYGDIVNDPEADTDAKAIAVANAELAKRNFDKKYVKIRTRSRLTPGTIYTSITIPETDVVSEDYAIDEVVIEGKGDGYWYTATLEPYDSTIVSKNQAWQEKFRQFINGKNSEVTVNGSDLFVQPDEPTSAPENSLWIDTDDFTLENRQDFVGGETVVVEDGRDITVTSAAATVLNLYSIAAEVAKSSQDPQADLHLLIQNQGAGTVTLTPFAGETINGLATVNVTSGQWAWLVGYGTDWKAKVW